LSPRIPFDRLLGMRFGLLGTGYWAAQVHAGALAAHDGVDFAGVWGRNSARAKRLAERYGVPAYDEVDALVEDVDAVAVAVPPNVQADLAVRAARAGRHLLLEKPLALDVASADRVVEAVDAGNLATLVFFTRRFVPSVATFIEDSAERGGWYAVHGTYYVSIFQPGSPYADTPWRRVHGGLWDVGPHALSYVVPLLGPVAEVSAVDGPYGTVHVLMRHASGGASTLSLTLDAPPGATATGFTYFGAHGTARLPEPDASGVQAFTRAVDELIGLADRSAEGEPARHPCDVHFGRDVVAVLAAADTARRERRIVAV
jgi:predicted dehydrogenase